MSKLFLILIVLVLVFVVYYVYVSTRLFEWDFKLNRLKPTNEVKIDLGVNLILKNPSVFSFVLRDINIYLFYEAKEIARTEKPIGKISIISNGVTNNNIDLIIPVSRELINLSAKYATKEYFKVKYIVSFKVLYLFTITKEGFYENIIKENG